MTTGRENCYLSPILDADDPELPFLASTAAVELDNLILGKSGASHAVATLAQRLQNCVERVAGIDEPRSVMDPATITVFNRAIEASGMTLAQTFGELARKVSEIANDLQRSDSSSDTFRRLRTFCANLAKGAVAHQRSRFEMQSGHETWC